MGGGVCEIAVAAGSASQHRDLPAGSGF